MTDVRIIEFPLVSKNDDGIRPAGPPDTCFYCHRKVGEHHQFNCVTVSKRVRVRYSYELEIDIPWFWEADNFEFHRNDGSWCADNSFNELNAQSEIIEASGECWCNRFQAEFIEVVDDTPRKEPDVTDEKMKERAEIRAESKRE